MRGKVMLLSGVLLIGGMFLATSCGGGAPPPSKPTSTPPAPKPVASPTPSPTASPAPATQPAARKTYSQPPPMIIDPNKQYKATIEMDKGGSMVLELFAKDVPKTVNNFVFLAREGFYDGTTFHRVIEGFMAQGGDPTGTGTGSPGYRFADEFTSHKHGTGTLSMANAGANTNGSQFFITFAPQPHLDGKHSVFGQVIQGMDVLQKIKSGDKIKRITIQES